MDMRGIALLPHAFHGEWNYSLDPHAANSQPSG
jgi:hypothetical protein